MNEVIRTLTNHRSIRTFTDKQVQEQDIDAIVKAAQAAPSWVNGQQVTIISVTDEQKKQKLSELVGHQASVAQAPLFFVFCADFYRTSIASDIENEPLHAVCDIDSLLVGATDVGLALGNAIAASESLGLGIVPIGGIRRNALEVIELLELPNYVIPISGLCIGYPNEDPGQKPRFPKEAILHEEVYNTADTKQQVIDYDQTMSMYTRERTNGESDDGWTKRIAGFYNKQYYKDVPAMLRKQGYDIKNL
ncbi:NADPH-dependent oxidoreductase [Desertibacillus haloalkaliphilus]|uniref:NADPH-dependent oxidoreductase n=1 Tax=Desertibacillus haloalkaliphilus TaxID=1328930 RepID=UPI001C25AC63|nr:NADPH-dependent oxidoreductase [Desertibacillus haloalkaliphilus]MBU8904978.1 NADPH-dependent oxidoreductase [Desertibacillus haloalkaliphilus]